MVFFMIFMLVLGSVILLSYALFPQPRIYLRLDETSRPERGKGLGALFNARNFDKILLPLAFLTRPIVGRITYLGRLKEQAEILRINLDISLLLAIKVLLGILLGFVAMILLSSFSVLYVPIGFLFGFFFPDFIIMRRVRAKKEAIIRCFPETVDLLHMCINAGADLISAIKWILEKSTVNPFIEQLGLVLSEVQVGKPRAEALRDMAKRLKIPDVSSFARVIVQAERMGTPVEEAFKNLSDDTRNSRYQYGERYAIKASLKILFPLLFCILPAIMIIVAGPIIIRFSQGQLMPTTF